MKKVIFVCLLSFAVCFSQPATGAGPAVQAVANGTVVDPNTATKSNNVTPAPSQPTQPTGQDVHPTIHSTEKAKTNTTSPAPETKKNVTDDSANKTTDKKDIEPPTTGKNETNVKPTTVVPAGNATKPDDGKKDATTQKSNVTPKPTEAPHKTDEPKTVQARGFDGASFIGGIILTLGMLAIGFMGFKYYKNQTERNYHTL